METCGNLWKHPSPTTETTILRTGLRQEAARKRNSSRDRRGAAKAASLSSARRKSAPAVAGG